MSTAVDFDAIPLLAGLDATSREAVLAVSRLVDVDTGESLFKAYAVTDALWVLLEGHWRVIRRVSGIEREMFHADRVGTWTGGIPIIDRIAPVKVEILAPSRFIAIPISAMEDAVAVNPRVAKRLLEAVHWGAGHIGALIQE